MNDSAIVRQLQRGGHLSRQFNCLCEFQRPGLQLVRQTFTFHQFHDDERAIDIVTVIINLHDVEMIQSRHRPGFGQKPSNRPAAGTEFTAQSFDRDASFQSPVAGFEHFAHASTTKRAEYYVPLRQTDSFAGFISRLFQRSQIRDRILNVRVRFEISETDAPGPGRWRTGHVSRAGRISIQTVREPASTTGPLRSRRAAGQGTVPLHRSGFRR